MRGGQGDEARDEAAPGRQSGGPTDEHEQDATGASHSLSTWPQPCSTQKVCSCSASSSSPRLCAVRFGDVDVLYHDVRLDDSKLPSDGLAPIGLGKLQEREQWEIDRYERQREEGADRRRGVGIIPPDDRLASLMLLPRSASMEALAQIEASNAQVRAERAVSLREYIYQIAYERVPPGETPILIK